MNERDELFPKIKNKCILILGGVKLWKGAKNCAKFVAAESTVFLVSV